MGYSKMDFEEPFLWNSYGKAVKPMHQWKGDNFKIKKCLQFGCYGNHYPLSDQIKSPESVKIWGMNFLSFSVLTLCRQGYSIKT